MIYKLGLWEPIGRQAWEPIGRQAWEPIGRQAWASYLTDWVEPHSTKHLFYPFSWAFVSSDG